MIRKNDEYTVEKRPIGGSEHLFEVRHKFSQDELMGYSRLFAEILIEPNVTIPLHQHNNEAEVFLVLEGELVSIAEDGSETPFRLGDYMLTGNGDKHSLRNDGDKLAKIMAIIMIKTV